MRAILLNERTDKAGLLGRPVTATTGMCSALNGTYQAGQSISLMNLRGIRDKLQKVQLAINGCNENLDEINLNLDLIEQRSGSLKEATSRLGDPWKSFINNPITPYSTAKFLDISTSLDRSREDLLGEQGYDPYSFQYDSGIIGNEDGLIWTNNIILPRGGIFILPNAANVLSGQSFWSEDVTQQPFTDPFGYRLPDGGVTAGYFEAGPRGPGSFPDYTSGQGIRFYGPAIRHADVTTVQTKEDETILDPSAKNIAVRPEVMYDFIRNGSHSGQVWENINSTPTHQIKDWGWCASDNARLWVSKPFYGDLDNYPNVEVDGRDFRVDGDRYGFGNVDIKNGCWVTVDQDLYSEDQENPYAAAGAVKWITVDGVRYDNIKYYRYRSDTDHFPCSNGGYKTQYFPSLGYDDNHVDIFGKPQSCYFRATIRVPGQTFYVVPKYTLRVETAKFDGNILQVPQMMVGFRNINQTVVVKTTGRFGYDPFYGGYLDNLHLVPTPKGTYYDMQVWIISYGYPILLLERTRVTYDSLLTTSTADFKFLEQVVYNFNPFIDPNTETGDFFSGFTGNLKDNKGKIREVYGVTFDGHTVSYRNDTRWRDVFNMLTVPPTWEFRKAEGIKEFYEGF